MVFITLIHFYILLPIDVAISNIILHVLEQFKMFKMTSPHMHLSASLFWLDKTHLRVILIDKCHSGALISTVVCHNPLYKYTAYMAQFTYFPTNKLLKRFLTFPYNKHSCKHSSRMSSPTLGTAQIALQCHHTNLCSLDQCLSVPAVSCRCQLLILSDHHIFTNLMGAQFYLRVILKIILKGKINS